MTRPPKDRPARETAFAKSQQCIFCGGASAATTVDHYPPRGIFTEHKWPEGYVFPACERCNQGSKADENWVALVSRMSVGKDGDGDGVIEDMRGIFGYFTASHPEVVRTMFQMKRAERRAAARRIGWRPAPGQLWSAAPVLRMPKQADAAVRVFANKLVRALHFEHTGKIVPLDAGMRIVWYTNVNQIEGKVPEELFTMLPGFASLRRTQVDLTDQFNYRYQVSDDGRMGMYSAWFRFSFSVHVILTFDPELMDRVEADAREDPDL